MRRRLLCVVVLVLGGMMVGVAPGWATSGGDNGLIVVPGDPMHLVDPSGGSDPIPIDLGLSLTDPAGGPAGPDFGGEPDWSPDGTTIVFRRSGPPDPDAGSEIFTVRPWEGNVDQLTDCGWFFRCQDPAWSPLGDRIVFAADLYRDTSDYGFDVRGLEIYVMGADGSDVRRLTTSSFYETQPDWSPLGNQIAFTRKDFLSQQPTESVWVMDADGSHQRFLAEGSSPSWSPDGTQIVFQGPVSESGRPTIIYVIAADGSSDPIAIATGELPVWSPDGTKIAFRSMPGDVWDIYVVSPDGSDETALGVESEARLHSAMSWQPVAPEPVGLVDPVSGVWRLRDGSGWVDEFFYGNPGDVPFMGDWDCDGTDTPGLYRQSDGFVYLRNSNSQGVADVRFFLGNPGDVPLAGDFDGDGCDTVSVYRPSQQRFYIINQLGSNDGGLGAADYWFAFGNPGDRPVVGDWDGDGIDEIGLCRESAGLFYYRTTLTTGVAEGEFSFGNPGDRFISGDFGAPDGVDTPGVYRPGQSRFYFRHTLTQGPADRYFTWGDPTWIPVTGDFTLP